MSTTKDYIFKYDKKPFKVRDGEPWFVLRAQDKLSVDAIRAYADLVRDASSKETDTARANELMKQALGVLKVAEAFQDWQDDNQELVKLPD